MASEPGPDGSATTTIRARSSGQSSRRADQVAPAPPAGRSIGPRAYRRYEDQGHLRRERHCRGRASVMAGHGSGPRTDSASGCSKIVRTSVGHPRLRRFRHTDEQVAVIWLGSHGDARRCPSAKASVDASGLSPRSRGFAGVERNRWLSCSLRSRTLNPQS